ncbi:MAG: hypothetical protein KZQ66_12890 [Candidatus Thiodiazotropha sp. (ex Lucinoma aequizonata)]|nr:hypothetical protein [Candidatus Thiodiazotropha sp. (ex Lucinoma aequizonata)]MCU7898924.1 hypothetical protein [Candidatus Thiodiazotropha sp. (ex Lucinoma aequizonata)]MCU7902778.1 hypothetical protein [Candidatus Thiodiazotropha sp. (ex Lucinoma aequizonata)]MCU7909533.1 hypothetical protein [Candidatus Thiodiazotropha sp. (ex Lucinoma aequizonata)]MCU7913972.1 hypothetical protein [Candidatus Thiodiazotropha sp. (ex Lucinoma aequizonata)]
MAITKQHSDQYKSSYIDSDAKQPTTDMAWRVRIMFFEFEQTGAGDQNSSFTVGKFPAGRVRVLLRSSLVFGTPVANNTIKFGWDTYQDASNREVAASTVRAEPTTGLHSRATTDPHPLWSQHSVTT